MAIEIERKFLVTSQAYRHVSPVYYCQGYLNRDRERTVRVRIAGDSAVLTIKGMTNGASRSEFEYAIPLDEARQMLKLCETPLIEKHRRRVPFQDMTWEVDEFLGENEGLVIAEIELESENQPFKLPDWIGSEVTHDPRYFNSNLSCTPYSQW